MEKRTFLYFLVLLSLLNFDTWCSGSTLKEPMSAQNGSILERNDNGDNNTQINISSDVANEYNHNLAYQTIGNLTNNRGVLVFCDKTDDSKIDEVMSIAKKIQEPQEKKIDEVVSIAKKIQETQEKKFDEVVSIAKKIQETQEKKIVEVMSKERKLQETQEKKFDEVMSIAKKFEETQEKKFDEVMSKIANKLQETQEKKFDEVKSKEKKLQETQEKKKEELVDLTKHLQTNLDKVVKILSESVSKPANDGKHPAFTGSSYVAIAAPEKIWNFNMSMDVKAAEPVTDGIIMYCEGKEDYGAGFMSLAVRQGRLEFRVNTGYNIETIVLTADRTLPANEWTHIEVSREGCVVSLRINSGAALEGISFSFYHAFLPKTLIFIGGVDASTDPKHNTDVSGGFKGCIKHVTLLTDRKHNLLKGVLRSANVQECRNDKWEIF